MSIVACRISGPSREAVQNAINAKMAEVEAHPHGGFAQFLHPWRGIDGVWMTRGEVVLYDAAEQVPA